MICDNSVHLRRSEGKDNSVDDVTAEQAQLTHLGLALPWPV